MTWGTMVSAAFSLAASLCVLNNLANITSQQERAGKNAKDSNKLSELCSLGSGLEMVSEHENTFVN